MFVIFVCLVSNFSETCFCGSGVGVGIDAAIPKSEKNQLAVCGSGLAVLVSGLSVSLETNWFFFTKDAKSENNLLFLSLSKF